MLTIAGLENSPTFIAWRSSISEIFRLNAYFKMTLCNMKIEF